MANSTGPRNTALLNRFWVVVRGFRRRLPPKSRSCSMHERPFAR